MNRPASAPLYSPQLLALVVELANFPFDAEAPFIGEARSRSCGSTLALSCDDQIQALGLQVTACAVGQASAAIFARHAPGKTNSEISQALEQIERWLSDDAAQPDWPDFSYLVPARDYPARHGAILLPWKAALDALSKEGEGR